MTEELLDKLKTDWQHQTIDMEGVRRRLHQARIRSYTALAADIVATMVGIAAGVIFAVMGWARHDWLFWLSAVMFLVIYPPFLIAQIRARRRSLIWVDRTPEGTLRYALTRLRANKAILELSFWGGVALLGFAGVLWTAAFVGLIEHRYPLGIVTTVLIAAAVVSISWSKWRMRRNTEERLAGERLIAAFVNATAADLE